MKNLKLLTLLLFVISFSYGQFFEGKVIYKNDYKSKMSNVTNEQITSMMGTTFEYFIKGGEYKTVTNGGYMQSQLYINSDNKIYNKLTSSPTILWIDAAKNDNMIEKVEVNKGATKILNYTAMSLS